MTKYRVTLTRQVRQEATLYVDALSSAEAEATACLTADVIWHNGTWDDRSYVKNTLEAHAERSEDVDRRDAADKLKDEIDKEIVRDIIDEAKRSGDVDKHFFDCQEALDNEFGS